MRKYGVPVVVAINEFITDTNDEIAVLRSLCAAIDVPVELASVWANGADGGVDLANTLINTIENNPAHYKRLYDNNLSVEEKKSLRLPRKFTVLIILFLRKVKTQIAQIVKMVGITYQFVWLKTQYSFQTIEITGLPQLALILLFVNWFPSWVQVLSLHLQEMS